MGCRYPGGVRSPEELWDSWSPGTTRSATSPTTAAGTWSASTTQTPITPAPAIRARAASSTTPASSTPAFFGISPPRGAGDGPQQRLLLEAAWEAFEDAGIDPAAAARQRHRRVRRGDAADYGPAGAGRGVERSPAPPATPGVRRSGRVAYAFGLEGPAVTVDTACSSSLVAVHLAAQALRSGECDLALAGGVTVLSTPGVFVEFSRQRGLAADGRCKSFAAAPTAPAGPRAWACSCWSGCPTRWPTATGAGGDARQRGQPGRRVERPHRAQRPLPGAGDPPGARQRRPHRLPTSTRSRPTAPAPRSATRSRPRRCSPPTARTGATAAAAGLDQVEHRPHPGRGRRRRGDQDGRWRCATGCCPRRCTWTSPRRTSTGRRARWSC